MRLGPGLPSAGALAVLAVAIVLLFVNGAEDAFDGGRDRGGSAAPKGKRVAALVTRVVDGDTAEMEIDGMSGEEDVRFIGIDTPESVAPGQPVECFGKEASDFTRGLIEGERVRLKFGAERRDRFGRLLAYVFLGDQFVNEELIRRGFARTLEIAPNTDFAGSFARVQQQAANAGLGLWGAC